MARGKYKKRKKETVELQLIKKTENLTPELLKANPGNTISGYCFTEKGLCPKIDPESHNCTAYINPENKCKMPNPNYGCFFSPTMRLEKVDKRITVSGRKSKKKKLGKVSSQTPGKTKGGNCVASPLERYCAKYARARKKDFYASVMSSIGKK